MPSPSPWNYGVAAPSVTDPYQSLEEQDLGASSGGLAAGEVVPASRKIGGSWKEAFDPNEPGLWILLGLLIAVGVLHVNVKAGGGANVGV